MKNISKILTAGMLLALHLPGLAQADNTLNETGKKKTAKSYIEISSGISAPVGHFAQTNYYDNRSGFALPGAILAISGVKYIGHTNFGLGGTISYAQYGVNGKNIALGYQDSYDVDSVNEHNTKYTAIHALVGPYYSIPVGIVTVDFHALAGVNGMFSPQIDILLEDGGNSYTHGGTQYTFWQQAASSLTLASQLGVGVRVSPVKHFAIALRVDYFYSRPVFNVNWEYPNPNAFSNVRYLTSYTQAFNGVNASLGLVYEF